MSRNVLALCTALLLAGGACGNDAGDPASFEQPFTDVEAYPVVVSSELVVGKNRMLLGLLSDRDERIAAPDVDVSLRLFRLGESSVEPAGSAETDFVWMIEPVQGVYVAEVEFDAPGKWGAEVSIEGGGYDETVRTAFEVAEEPVTPAIGSTPPRSKTPTGDDVKNLSAITTDPDPNRRFYELSVAEAIASGDPSVIVFATPKFCTSQVCGPTLDVVKQVAGGFPGVDFVHVEVYELPADPSDLDVVAAVEEWGLPSEPWVFVLDRDGEVAAKYEGTVGPQELRSQLEELT